MQLCMKLKQIMNRYFYAYLFLSLLLIIIIIIIIIIKTRKNEYDVYMVLINVPFLIEYMGMEMECFELE